MFKSYRYEHTSAHNPYEHYYTIIDDDFQETIVMNHQALEVAVIELYERKRLPIAPNVIRCALYAIQSGEIRFEELNRINNHQLTEYLPDIVKYMTLL